MALVVKNCPSNAQMQGTRVRSLAWEDLLEESVAILFSSILAWKIPQTEKSGGLQVMGPQRVRQDEQLHFHFHYIS